MTPGAGTTESSPDADASRYASRARRVAVALGIGAAYYLSARVGLRLSLVGNDVTPLWPPTGVAVAALIVFGRTYWPAVALAALAVNLLLNASWSWVFFKAHRIGLAIGVAAALAVSGEAKLPLATMRATLWSIRSEARAGNRS